jgi:hypothetical protein
MNNIKCSSCKWEINTPNWWDIAKDYEGKYLCDDCATTLELEERGNE